MWMMNSLRAAKMPTMLRFPAISTWGLNEALKLNMMQQVNFGGMNLTKKYYQHGKTQYYSVCKPVGFQEGPNRNMHTLIRGLPSPKFSLKEWTQIKNSPPAAIGLGVGGLIPFISAPTYLIYQGVYCPDIAYAQFVYGAVILSFLGGIKWGCAIATSSAEKPSWKNLGLSTVSSLTAWSALLVPQQLGMVVVTTGITVATYIDLISIGYPLWFKALRISLSSVAVTTLILTLILSLVQKKNTENKDIKETTQKS